MTGAFPFARTRVRLIISHRRFGFPKRLPKNRSVLFSRNYSETNMTQSVLFATWLNDILQDRKMSADELQYLLDYRTPIAVRSWLEGQSRPPLWQLPALAQTLRADPVEVIVGWCADQLPEMEPILRIEVLDPRHSTFPRSDDLALRAPKHLKLNPSL